ncbi:MAG: M23 family metallopeptidase [Syntrophomonadaceae bacterium]|nr:M23 family metallopeptidase [Syntrophomonadaceae bacterium]
MRKIKKKANEQMTLIIIPATTAKPYSLGFPQVYARWAKLAAGMIILALFSIGIWFFISRAELYSINRLKVENQQKQETINKMNQEIKIIEEQQESLIKKQNEIKKQMGLQRESGASSEPSRGSEAINTKPPSDSENIAGRAEYIARQLAQQEKEINEMLTKVKKQTAYYRSLPNQWPVYGEISSEYGWRISPFSRNEESFHEGIDIKGTSGTPIMAAGDGIVTFSGWKAIYGRTVEVEHSCGLITKYGHNSSCLVKKGDKVAKGDIIARVGNTGLSTGPHLHFAVLKGDSTQDPMIYLPEMEEKNT